MILVNKTGVCTETGMGLVDPKIENGCCSGLPCLGPVVVGSELGLLGPK